MDEKEKNKTFLDMKSNDKRFLGEELVIKKSKEEGIKLERPWRPAVLLKTKKEFEKYARHYSYLHITSQNGTDKILKDIYVWKETNEASKYSFDKQHEVYGTMVLPDFIMMNTNTMIEIKTGKYARLEKNQREEFPKILQKGFRIFIIRPKLLIDEKIIKVTNYECSELVGPSKLEKSTFENLLNLSK